LCLVGKEILPCFYDALFIHFYQQQLVQVFIWNATLIMCQPDAASYLDFCIVFLWALDAYIDVGWLVGIEGGEVDYVAVKLK